MSSGKEEQIQKTKKTVSTSPSEKTKPKGNSPVCHNKYLIFVLSIIVSFVALGIAAYTLFLNKQLHAQLSEAQNNFSTHLQQLEQKQDQAQELINAKTNNAEEIQKQLQTKFESLSKQLQNAMSQKFYQNQDWLLLKARYYLELAQINAHWSYGVDSTVVLLEQADQLLKQLNGPKILEIRQAIAKDIAQNQALPSVDIAGLLSQLDAAQHSINDLSIPLPISENVTSTGNSTTPTSNSLTWRTHIQNSVNILEKLVVIRRHDQEIKPLLSPALEAILKEKLRLNLQEAQWAILNNEPSVYQLVLKQAIDSLKMNFNANMPKTAALIKKLTELQQKNIAQKRPSMGPVLPMINELIDTQKYSANQSINSEQGGNP
ncbi:uroporphyrinogen-III C-methyltransferase [Legionella parisiensis]|uniref:Putative uroporphyrinogen-III C-methyltransferase n=1 Tax=Legionella parisiensis TaxID=45071 RepID=A0A1E5JRB5_9GAMM|nr:uroporphyrinogen-III C-methyltransferase [Legionella parisiensis]KTD44791.1 uroporphyrinogen III methylase HemX [Legionella parisiensis]OEH47055.1 putative uroporphyrinogen-III C-methyltransferase [Legionella parisiensis]STX71774.1 uroporphyrinogen III methylase HemX [Legionella parisiensis]